MKRLVGSIYVFGYLGCTTIELCKAWKMGIYITQAQYLPQSTIGVGKQGFPFAQPYLSLLPVTLVVRWVTTCESGLLIVFAIFR